MDNAHLTSPPRKTPTRHLPETWTLIRRLWESGRSARECGRRHDVHHSTVELHRKHEGWTRTAASGAPESTRIDTLDGLVDSAVSEILSAYKAQGHQAAREIAKSAEIFARLRSRLSTSSRHAPGHGDDVPAFTPERNNFELLNELGLAPEDVH